MWKCFTPLILELLMLFSRKSMGAKALNLETHPMFFPDKTCFFMSLADIHNIFLAKDRANSPTAAEILRQHYGLPALAELNKASKRFGEEILKAVSQQLVFLGIRTVETIR